MEISKNIVCIYAYYEKDQDYRNNLEYFLEKGINEKMDYVFVVNGESTVNIDKGKVIKRDNKGYDFGAFSYALQNLDKQYDYYIFLNTSVKGPYSKEEYWQDEFINLIKDDVKVVGTTIYMNKGINVVQTMMFAMDLECLDFIKDDIFKDENLNSHQEVIQQKEIKMSQLILKNGWNISCTAKKLQNIDYRVLKDDINPTSVNGDPYFPGGYFGETLDKDEIVFIKTNRGIL